MRHTPGPWHHYDDTGDNKTNRHEIVALGKTICHIYASVPHEDAANASLITAAPELLAALKAVEDDICGLLCPSMWKTAEGRPPCSERCRIVKAAIAKAEGK